MSGTGPASVLGQTGIQLKIVEWVQDADKDIQNLLSDGAFLVRDFDFPTTIDKQIYTTAEALVPELNKWIIDRSGEVRCRLLASDEQFIEYVPWAKFRQTYLMGPAREIKGRPGYFTIKPDKSMALFPTPDKEYRISGEYRLKAQMMAANGAEPLYPSEFHMAAVWRALMLYGAYEAADERYSHGQNEFRRILGLLRADQMPRISWGAPLA